MSFQQELLEDSVQSLTLRSAIIVQPHTLARAAIALMRHHSLGCAVIVERGLHPTGIFTERSVIDMLKRGVCLDEAPISDFADPKFETVSVSDPIMRVWEAVRERAVRYVCVTDEDGRTMGITGQRGLSEYLADCFAKQVTVQRLGSTPWMQQREGA